MGRCIYIYNTQIYKGDPRPHNHISPRVMASSAKGLKCGSWGFCRPHMQTQNKCIHDLHFTHVYLYAQTTVECRWHTHLTIFWLWRNLKTPSPNFRMKITQVLRLCLLYICETTLFSGGKQARENILGEDQPEVNLCRKTLILPRILDILILQDKTLFCAFEAGDIVCWLVNPPIAKLDLFKSPDCRWICKTYAEYCCRSSATVRRLVQSPTLQSTIFCGVHCDLRGRGIRVSPAWYYQLWSTQA